MGDYLFICKASTQIGVGHLMRSKTLALDVKSLNPDKEVDLWVVGDKGLHPLVPEKQINIRFFSEDAELLEVEVNCHTCFFDMLSLSPNVMHRIKLLGIKTVSLSPIFDKQSEVDYVFSRVNTYSTHNGTQPKCFYGSMEYAVISPACVKVSESVYRNNLDAKELAIGVTMGGGDAANRTLSIIEELKNVKARCTFWIMLGEGYKHSLDNIIKAAESDLNHSIILAKNNQSIWKLLQHCSLVITSSGITSYEAVYAGIPSIVFYENDNQYFLINELLNKGVAINGGVFNTNSISLLSAIVDDLYLNRKKLYEMHLAADGLIDRKAAERILRKVHEIQIV